MCYSLVHLLLWMKYLEAVDCWSDQTRHLWDRARSAAETTEQATMNWKHTLSSVLSWIFTVQGGKKKVFLHGKVLMTGCIFPHMTDCLPMLYITRREPTCIPADPAPVSAHETGDPAEPGYAASSPPATRPGESSTSTGNTLYILTQRTLYMHTWN